MGFKARPYFLIMMTVFLITITIIAILISVVCISTKQQVDEKTKEINQEIYQKNQSLNEIQKVLTQNVHQLQETYNQINESVSKQSHQKQILEETIKNKQEQLDNFQNNAKNALERQTELSRKAYENYCDVLDNQYKQKEKEYEQLEDTLKNSYAAAQDKLLQELDQCKAELDKIRQSRDAAIQAQRKEKEIKEKLSFYCLTPSNNDLDDVKRLERIKPDLHNPRILSMLIWSTYFQKPMTALCNNILGTEEVTGIYKITNQFSGECYVGQAVDLATRWKQHAKCGLGIDTPANNKLYKAMMADGIWNFSWELLEKCPKEQLNEKEKFYINLYQSYEYGYNSNTGISK